jgi:putative inorganic carbon (HCO3(-)) transporter
MRDKIDVERYMTLKDISSDYNVSSEGGRFELWKSAIALTLDNPITGVGMECYPFAHLQARQLAGESFLRWQYTHNSYLQVAAEIGLVGFAIFAFIILRSLVTFSGASRTSVRPETRETDEIRVLGGLMLLGFVGLLVSGFFLSQGYSIFFTLYFALAAAMKPIQAALSNDIDSRYLKDGRMEMSKQDFE